MQARQELDVHVGAYPYVLVLSAYHGRDVHIGLSDSQDDCEICGEQPSSTAQTTLGAAGPVTDH
jgi:hypothetical protein